MGGSAVGKIDSSTTTNDAHLDDLEPSETMNLDQSVMSANLDQSDAAIVATTPLLAESTTDAAEVAVPTQELLLSAAGGNEDVDPRNFC